MAFKTNYYVPLRVLGQQRRSNQSILKEISPEYSLGRLCWSWNPNTLATWCEELAHLKKPWCWERLRAGGEGDNRGWGSWMASLTQWTWVELTLGVGDGQGCLAYCSPWGHKESDTTEPWNWSTVWPQQMEWYCHFPPRQGTHIH